MTHVEDPAIATQVQQWRRSVVRSWIATMIGALAIGAGAAIWPLTTIVEMSAAVTLLLLAGRAYRVMRSGRCPRCGTPIRFEPRLELPLHCTGCGAAFSQSGMNR